MSTIAIRLPDEVADRLDALAARLGRSSAQVAARAVGEFLDRQASQIDEIEAALREAGRGEFADEGPLAAPTA